MELAEKITQMIEPSLAAMGYALVQVKLLDGSRRKALQIMAERSDRTPMGFDDCVEISRTVGALMEVEDPIATAYDLEVSSPGLDRPLTKIADFERFKGEGARIETLIPIDGRKRFRGLIENVAAKTITIRMSDNNEMADIDFSNIRSAKLSPENPLEKQGPVRRQAKKGKKTKTN